LSNNGHFLSIFRIKVEKLSQLSSSCYLLVKSGGDILLKVSEYSHIFIKLFLHIPFDSIGEVGADSSLSFFETDKGNGKK
jgi:hypothetical protein